MSDDAAVPEPVELRRAAGAPGRYEAWGHGRRIGGVGIEVSGPIALVRAVLDRAPEVQQDATAVVIAAVGQAKREGAVEIELECAPLFVRHEARRVGFGGGLRVALQARADDVAWPVPAAGARGLDSRQDRAAWLVAAMGSVGVAATAARPSRPLARMARRLSGGVGDTLEVIVQWGPGRSFVISAPDRADILPEALALAGDTARGVLRRFPDHGGVVQYVYFDRAIYGFKEGQIAGMTEGAAPSIHLNIDYVAAGATIDSMRRRDAAGDGVAAAVRAWPDLPSAGVPAPFTFLDGTVAHEIWHKVESVFEARAYRSSIEFRRGLGAALGVETLEHAIKGAEPAAPAAWREAHERLRREASDYATTNIHEATAELFKLWWCRDGSAPPLVVRFGELIDEFMPPPAA